MKFFLGAMMLGFVIGCVPQTPDEGPTIPIDGAYRQDIESCTLEPSQTWCQRACETQSYEWCTGDVDSFSD